MATTRPTPEQTAQTNDLYAARQERRQHPRGSFDKAGRWYPAESEACSCCAGLRSPSQRWPYSLMLHCRTRKHVANLVARQAAA